MGLGTLGDLVVHQICGNLRANQNRNQASRSTGKGDWWTMICLWVSHLVDPSLAAYCYGGKVYIRQVLPWGFQRGQSWVIIPVIGRVSSHVSFGPLSGVFWPWSLLAHFWGPKDSRQITCDETTKNVRSLLAQESFGPGVFWPILKISLGPKDSWSGVFWSLLVRSLLAPFPLTCGRAFPYLDIICDCTQGWCRHMFLTQVVDELGLVTQMLRSNASLSLQAVARLSKIRAIYWNLFSLASSGKKFAKDSL